MKLGGYETIIHFIRQHPSKCSRTVLSDVMLKFGEQFAHNTLLSVFLTEVQNTVKKTFHTKCSEKKAIEYYQIYKKLLTCEKKTKVQNEKSFKHVSKEKENIARNQQKSELALGGVSSNKETSFCSNPDSLALTYPASPVLITMANEAGLPPFLMARIIVEQTLLERNLNGNIAYDAGNSENCSGTTERTQNNENCLSVERGDKTHLQQQSASSLEMGSAQKFIEKESSQNQLLPVSLITYGMSSKISQSNIITTSLESRGGVTEHMEQSGAIEKKLSTKFEDETFKCDHPSHQTDVRQNRHPQSLKNKLSAMMKNPGLIPDSFLRDQVKQCISYDVCYGPINDAIRHSVGLEYEEKLITHLTQQNLPFLTENDLRKRGYDKTPDTKLEVPIAVNDHPVCWIESKASFGDLETHKGYLREQYYSYWNRFGPGLVIYWFGFIESIEEEMKRQGILIMDRFPSSSEITFMNSV